MKTIVILAGALLLLAGVIALSILQDAKTNASGSYEGEETSPGQRTRELVVRPDRLRATVSITSASIAAARVSAEHLSKTFLSVAPTTRLTLKDATAEGVIRADIDVPLSPEDDFWKRATLLEDLQRTGRKLEKKGEKKERIEVSAFVPELANVDTYKGQLVARWGAHVKEVGAHAKGYTPCTPDDHVREAVLSLEEIELALDLHCPTN